MLTSSLLFLFSVLMAIGSFVAGSIPLFCYLSEATVKKFTSIGAGLLIGTAFTVIIPEGIKAALRTGHGSVITTSTNNGSIDSYVGFPLLFGFIFMLGIDQIAKRINRLENRSQSGALTATIGLVVHAAADGIALGAAASTSQLDIEIIIFLAIMIHKAPSAFGLVSFLLHENIERRRIRSYLLAFSLAAPVTSLVTYFGLNTDTKTTLSMSHGPAVAMLFSAGTFLYVAIVHVLAELLNNSRPRTTTGPNRCCDIIPLITTASEKHSVTITTATATATASTSSGGGGGSSGSHVLDSKQLFLLIFGCLLPYLLTSFHNHSD